MRGSESFVKKQDLRSHLKKIRIALPPRRREEGTREANEYLREKCQVFPLVLSFASFGSEIDLWPLNRILASEGRLVLPRIIKGELQLHLINHLTDLKIHDLGMLEPDPILCPLANVSSIALALIPGLGFDRETLHRLGFGKGSYDKFLATAPTSIETWGIGFLEQAIKPLPYTKYDVPLHAIHLF